ncbi:MAG: POTRA domain-containing protein [Bacteroidales bacterium]|nr:POTRA domain-containing protein [Bacteroidales bacterium]
MKKTVLLLPLFFLLLNVNLKSVAQVQIGSSEDIVFDYSNPKEYEIGGITVSGVQYYDNNSIIALTGLAVGDKIKVPGEAITSAIQKLWSQNLFEDIQITASKIEGKLIFLNIDLKERARLSRFSITGVRKSEADEIRDDIKLSRGDIVTEHLLINTEHLILKRFRNKGFFNAKVDIREEIDTTLANSLILFINVTKNKKIKINEIYFEGNNEVAKSKLIRSFKDTKEKFRFYPFEKIDTFLVHVVKNFQEYRQRDLLEIASDYFSERVKLRIFKSSKFIAEDYETDKLSIISQYNAKGYRNARIISDTIYKVSDRLINIGIRVEEGNQFHFRNINWVGNTLYTDEYLSSILDIQKGEVYNQKTLESNLMFNPNGLDVYSLYLDDGYLFFSANPVEVKVENDSIDIEIRINEGKQARINKITIVGNTRTNDNVIMRELRTVPGQLFSRADIIRSQRELAQLRYFNQETIGINPKPNPIDGTVDIEYTVEETSSDQLELSGGWGAGMVVGTIGVSFNNFSTKKFFDSKSWRPIPSGDGQKISIRAQSNGSWYQAYSASFTEPWLGGKRPNAFSVSAYHSVQSNGLKRSDEKRQSIDINGVSVSLAQRLKWPDDYFILSQGVSFQNYVLNNYSSIFSFSDGYSNNASYLISLSRNSIDAPIYPRRGSEIGISLQVTPPYSLFKSIDDYSEVSDQDKYRWLEYHKWKFNASWYTNIVENLVASLRFKFGYLGAYNNDIGISPFERFYLGGDGLSGFALDGRELVGMRGYGNNTLTPKSSQGYVGASVYTKYTGEIRYPVSLNPSATIYLLTFVESGNTWSHFNEFNPFKMYKSAGFGVRVFLPMFGVLGLDWGYGFDDVPGVPGASKGQFHFSINQSID